MIIWKKKRLEEADAAEEVLPGATKTQIEKEKRKQRLQMENKKALAQRVKDLEKRIAEAEAEILRLECEMGDPEIYKDPNAAQRVAKNHADTQALLEQLYEEWSEASETMDS